MNLIRPTCEIKVARAKPVRVHGLGRWSFPAGLARGGGVGGGAVSSVRGASLRAQRLTCPEYSGSHSCPQVRASWDQGIIPLQGAKTSCTKRKTESEPEREWLRRDLGPCRKRIKSRWRVRMLSCLYSGNYLTNERLWKAWCPGLGLPSTLWLFGGLGGGGTVSINRRLS